MPHIVSARRSTHRAITQADPIQVVKVLYDYDAAEPTELTVKEDDILNVYVKDDDWLLVSSRSEQGRIGYVPGNYVEEVRLHDCLHCALTLISLILD